MGGWPQFGSSVEFGFDLDFDFALDRGVPHVRPAQRANMGFFALFFTICSGSFFVFRFLNIHNQFPPTHSLSANKRHSYSKPNPSDPPSTDVRERRNKEKAAKFVAKKTARFREPGYPPPPRLRRAGPPVRT